jgi:hypothetical protein
MECLLDALTGTDLRRFAGPQPSRSLVKTVALDDDDMYGPSQNTVSVD